MRVESDDKVLSVEETKKVQNEYLASLKAKCRLQILFGEDPFQTYVVVDDQVVGFIQRLFVEVDSEDQFNRTVEVALPKVGCKADIKEHAKNLASLGFVNVVYKSLNATKNKAATMVGDNKPYLVEEEKVFATSSDADFEKSLAMVRGQNEQAG